MEQCTDEIDLTSHMQNTVSNSSSDVSTHPQLQDPPSLTQGTDNSGNFDEQEGNDGAGYHGDDLLIRTGVKVVQTQEIANTNLSEHSEQELNNCDLRNISQLPLEYDSKGGNPEESLVLERSTEDLISESLPTNDGQDILCSSEISSIQSEAKIKPLSADLSNIQTETKVHSPSSDTLNIQSEISDKRLLDEKTSNQSLETESFVCSEPPNKKIKMCETIVDTDIPQEEQMSEVGASRPLQSSLPCVSDTTCFLLRKPIQVTGAWSEFTKDNYLRGCKWSPDGGCLLTTTSDNRFHLYDLPEPLCNGQIHDLPEMACALRTRETHTVYDYCWYNKMSSSDPDSCVFLSTSKDNPIHLWDVYTGELRSSYRAYDQADELVAAYGLAFSQDGTKIYSGFNKMIRIFDTNRPGRECESRPTYSKDGGQVGIISCLASSPQGGGLFAAGSYSRGIGLYYEAKKEALCVFEGQQGGVTHIAFSPDGTKLYSGGRKDPEILCWDLRMPGQILFVALRQVETNQRIYFDQDSSGRFLISGNHNGTITIWDTLLPPVQKTADTDFLLEHLVNVKVHKDTVNGVSVHPSLPLIATSSGQRHFPDFGDSDDSSSEEDLSSSIDNSLRLWWFVDE